jgi:hypothetical protein
MQASVKNVRLRYRTYQSLMALAGELQAEKGNRVTANDTVAMLLNDYLAKEIEAKESGS